MVTGKDIGSKDGGTPNTPQRSYANAVLNWKTTQPQDSVKYVDNVLAMAYGDKCP